jgi:hypothetical protein
MLAGQHMLTQLGMFGKLMRNGTPEDHTMTTLRLLVHAMNLYISRKRLGALMLRLSNMKSHSTTMAHTKFTFTFLRFSPKQWQWARVYSMLWLKDL